jgi:purine-nucleoside phosphorylase
MREADSPGKRCTYVFQWSLFVKLGLACIENCLDMETRAFLRLALEMGGTSVSWCRVGDIETAGLDMDVLMNPPSE